MFSIKSPTATTVTSGLNPSTYGQAVVLTAKPTPTFGAVATGTVTFKDRTTTLGAVAARRQWTGDSPDQRTPSRDA